MKYAHTVTRSYTPLPIRMPVLAPSRAPMRPKPMAAGKPTNWYQQPDQPIRDLRHAVVHRQRMMVPMPSMYSQQASRNRKHHPRLRICGGL
jgi:hypothetical protein